MCGTNRFRLTVAMVFISSVALARQSAPLPSALLSARTMYVENNSGQSKIGDSCSNELSKWGRFKLVKDAKEADVIFRIDPHLGNYGSGGSSADDDKSSKGVSSQDTAGFATVSVLDQKGQVLWSDTRRWGSLFNGSKAAIRDVVKQLRKRIEEQDQNKP